MTLMDTDVSEPSVDVPPILLPAAGDGQRRRRRYERQRVMRQRWMAGGAVVVAAFAAVLLLRGTHTGKPKDVTSTAGSAPATSPAAVDPNQVVAPPSVLVQHVTNGRTSSITAFLPSAEGGGTVLVFPADTTMTAVAANLPRQKADTILTVTSDELTRLFQKAGPLVVTLAGQPSTVAPEQVPAFFEAKNAAEAIAHQRAYWDAWLSKVSGDAAALPTSAPFATAAAAIAKGTWTVAVPPGTAGG